MNDVQYAVHIVAEFSKFSGLVLNKNKIEALMIGETITSVTSQTHCLLLIRGQNAQIYQVTNILAHTPNPHDYHIYIIGGYCDINERISHPLHHLRNIHNRQAHYEAFIFRENTLVAISRVANLITKASDQIHSLHALPIICTIPPSNLVTWSHTRLNQHKTAMLEFYPQYPEMQHNSINTISGINTNITSINQSRHAFTLKLAFTIITKPGKNKNTEFTTQD